ncbi:MAG: nucleoside deaminase [Bacteroidaceae bacterium]|nr:nucleoside deaminase [Bacteroidaceae bacterium]
MDEKFMQMAIDLSLKNVQAGGGPFGAVIVKDGEVLATGVNRVTLNNDPTAHAEVSAIRAACEKIGDFRLRGCTIYTSCEPCPMCLAAIYWAGISRIYYGNTKEDAAAINFDDKFIYDEMSLPVGMRSVPTRMMMREQAAAAFQAWTDYADKVEY